MKIKNHSKFDWSPLLKQSWEKPNCILHPAHNSRLQNILKDAVYTCPKLHPLFNAIIDAVFHTSSSCALSLHDFWSIIIDDAFFNSNSHDRKFIGFLLFQLCLSHAFNSRVDDVGVLFSRPFLRCLINSLAKGDDAVLNKAAKATAKQISLIATTTTSTTTTTTTSRQLGLQVVFQLIGKNGHQRFDSITKTRTVELIVAGLNESDVDSYVEYLLKLVVTGVSESSSLSLGESDEAKASSTTRMWALDQLHSLLKAPKVPKSEAWIKKVLRFLCVHSLFIVEKSGNGIEKIEGGELGSEVREYCRGRFFAGLAEVNGFALTVGDKKLAPGVMQNGEYWSYDLMQFILELDGTALTFTAGTPGKKKTTSSNPSAPIVRPVNALEARTLEARNMAVKEIISYRTKVASLSKSKDSTTTTVSSTIAQYKSFELLFLHVLLQVYTEPVDAVNILDELKSCADLVFSDNTPPTPSGATPQQKKKRTAAEMNGTKNNDDDEEDEDEDKPNPVDVIIDILLSFLAKPSALFRGVVENVFKVFAPLLTESGLGLVFDILKAKSGVAGAEELFEEEGDDDDDDDEDDEDDVEEIDASEFANGQAGQDEEEDDDMDSDDSDDDDDDEESEIEEDNIDELKNRLMAALGGVAGDAADMNPDDMAAEDDDDEKSLGDDEMEAFDEKLSAIFRERKKAKNQQRDTKQQVLHFKLRAVDLLDIYIRKQPTNPLILSLIMPSLAIILETAESEESRELHTKMCTLVRTRLGQIKETPTVDTLENGIALLKQVQELAAKAPSASVAALCSQLSLLITRAIAHSHPEGVAITTTASGQVEPPSAKKKKTNNDKKAVAAAPSPAVVVKSSPVIQVYAASMLDFMTRKKSKIQTSLFLDLCNRHPALGLQLLPDIAECIAKGQVEKGFKIVQGFNVMGACLQKLPVKDNAANTDALARFQQAFLAALLESTKVNEEKGMTVARIKELVKPCAGIVRRLKKAGGSEADLANVKKSLESRDDDVKTALKGLLAVF
ncbi:DNA polymerase phi-domain-containing protein [Obelidium mucronatum]|nr:DNA polymerase phi-domain-containing protein [Obelidium mucronatum]